MECADWLSGGFDSAQARFLMLTAITHHRFSSRVWGEHEVRRLYAELTEIDVSADTRVQAACQRLDPQPRFALVVVRGASRLLMTGADASGARFPGQIRAFRAGD